MHQAVPGGDLNYLTLKMAKYAENVAFHLCISAWFCVRSQWVAVAFKKAKAKRNICSVICFNLVRMSLFMTLF